MALHVAKRKRSGGDKAVSARTIAETRTAKWPMSVAHE